MQVGETAVVRVGWQYGYGEKGNFSFPQVPPKADLEYDVTLIDFSPAEEVSVDGTLPTRGAHGPK